MAGALYQVDADQLGWWLCERQLPSGGLNGTCVCVGGGGGGSSLVDIKNLF